MRKFAVIDEVQLTGAEGGGGGDAGEDTSLFRITCRIIRCIRRRKNKSTWLFRWVNSVIK